jgi:hypothetical protein
VSVATDRRDEASPGVASAVFVLIRKLTGLREAEQSRALRLGLAYALVLTSMYVHN